MDALDRTIPMISRIARWVLNVRDLDCAVRFYAEALGSTVTSLAAEHADLAIGAQSIRLVRQPNGRAYPTPRAANDPWFQHLAIAVDDMDAAYLRLLPYLSDPITRGGPQLLPPSTGSVTAYKFRDPDGHPLELSFVPGSDWSHRAVPPGTTSLGIDHSAIVVRDLEASIVFYTWLGFRLGARLLNQGPEQARLDGLDQPVVDIVILRMPEPGPHIELLHYRSPASAARRPMGPSDIAATLTELELQTNSAESPASFGDPDGHLLCISQPGR